MIATRKPGRWIRSAAVGGALVFGCNGLLGNESGHLGTGGTGGMASAGGEAGAAGNASTGGEIGAAGNASAGGRVGASGAAGVAGEAPANSGAGSGGLAGGERNEGGSAGQAGSAGAGGELPASCVGAMRVCTPSMPDAVSQACGKCGSQSRTRTCQADCTWGPWGAWSMCAGEKTCTAGEKGTVNDRCPNACGARTQTRTCSSACEWGPLTVTSSSCVDCNDCSEVVFCDSHEHVANRGTWCRRTSDKCNVAELDQDCAADIASPDVCNGKLVQPLYKDWL